MHILVFDIFYIIVKEAEKGSAVLIIDREYYKSLCLTVLENDM